MQDAKALFKREFGTCKGIRYIYGSKPDQYGSGFEMNIGKINISAVHDTGNPFIVVFVSNAEHDDWIIFIYNIQTMERNFAQEVYARDSYKRDLFTNWVNNNSPEYCCEQVMKAWKG